MKRVAILGATGMVGRRLSALLVDHPQFETALLIGSGASKNQSFEAVWTSKEEAARTHYGSFWQPAPYPAALVKRNVESFEALLESDIDIVFSSVPEHAGHLEAELVRSGRLVFSNSPYARFDDDVPVIVPEVNADALGPKHRLIKNPNCVTSGLVIVLKALANRYGIAEAAVTTYQSLSGRGDAKYDRDKVVNNIYPLHGSDENTERYIRAEVKKVLATAPTPTFPISVACYRVPTQEGHLVDVRLKTRERVKSRDAVIQLLSEFKPLSSLALRSAPEIPLVFVPEIGRPRPRQDAWHAGGMAVAVGNLSTDDDEVFDVRLSFVVNNLVRGAAGGALLNAELWNRQR
jgi:aspartate-semialdehyde dehydrogenase